MKPILKTDFDLSYRIWIYALKLSGIKACRRTNLTLKIRGRRADIERFAVKCRQAEPRSEFKVLFMQLCIRKTYIRLNGTLLGCSQQLSANRTIVTIMPLLVFMAA
jgi:hypothetical protein